MPLIMKKTINGQPVKIRLTDGTLYAGLPIGFILPSFEDETPLGFLKMTDTLANRTVSRTTYKELFDWATARGLIGTGKPFGVGDGSTTFVIPDGKEIAFKGIGEYEGTVGAHVKSGGLANGEFIDDRLQNHTHYESANAGGSAQVWGVGASSSGQQTGWLTGTVRDGRRGDTTEVKSLGCHYYIKAMNIGVPADFVSEIDDVIGERLSYSTTEINTGKKWIDGKTIYSKVLTGTFGVIDGSAWVYVNVSVADLNIGTVTKMTGFIEALTYAYPIPYTWDNGSVSKMIYHKGQTRIRVASNATGASEKPFYITIEYTKATN